MLIFPRWGSRYDYGDDAVKNSLLEFAVQKLLCGHLENEKALTQAQIYAVLSQRLAIDINTPHYLFPAAEDSLKTTEAIHKQVENHMRVCVAVGDGIESLRAIAPSEPILSEASSYIMQSEKFQLHDALAQVLGGYNINQGERGELLVFSFFTWARDQVVKTKPRSKHQICPYFSATELLSHLFTESTFASMLDCMPSVYPADITIQPFREVFSKALMHFNHVVKAQVQALVAHRWLPFFIARGAAVLGANCQMGVDAVYPFLYGSIDLDVKNVGFIMVQVKNQSKLHSKCITPYFQGMDPFDCGLLEDSVTTNGRFPIPIIRILFSLSGPGQPGVTHWQYLKPSDGAEMLGKDGQPKFTSYDFLCTGVSPEVLQAVKESPGSWQALVNKANPWDSFYKGLTSDVLRSQLPICSIHPGHFTAWSELP